MQSPVVLSSYQDGFHRNLCLIAAIVKEKKASRRSLSFQEGRSLVLWHYLALIKPPFFFSYKAKSQGYRQADHIHILFSVFIYGTVNFFIHLREVMKLTAFKVPKNGICNTPLCTDTMLPPRSAVTGEKQAKRQRHKGPPSLFFDKESLLFFFFKIHIYIYIRILRCVFMYCAFVCMILRSHGTQVTVTSPKEGIWTAEVRGGSRLFNHGSCAKWYSKTK